MYLLAAIAVAAAQLWRAEPPRSACSVEWADVYGRLHDRGAGVQGLTPGSGTQPAARTVRRTA
jgi:hypothetical protein